MASQGRSAGLAVAGFLIGAVLGALITYAYTTGRAGTKQPFATESPVTVGDDGNSHPKHVGISPDTGPKFVHWQASPGATLEITDIKHVPLPTDPPGPPAPLTVHCGPNPDTSNQCWTNVVQKGNRGFTYSYTPCVTIQGTRTCGTDPWIHVDP